MNDRIRTWLRIAPMPDMKEWLESLYVDNILKVSRGGENVQAAFAEYGKKLLADKILEEHMLAKEEPTKGFSLERGSEILTGVLVFPEKKED